MTLVAFGVTVTAMVSAWLLVRPTGSVNGQAARGARFIAAGVLVAAVSTVGAAAADRLSPRTVAIDVPLPAAIPNVGLFFTAGMYLIGLLLLPGAASSLLGRVRRSLDGVSVGVCAFFVAWLLVFSRAGLRGAGLTAVLLASIAVAVAVVAGLRTAGVRSAAVLAALGPAVSIGGLAGLTVDLDYHVCALWRLLAGAALVAGPPAAWYGMRAVGAGTERPAVVDDGARLIGYPLVALPLVGAVLAAGYHAFQGRRFDRTSIVLGIVGVAVIAVREALAALDVRRYAGRLARLEAHFRSLVAGGTDVTAVLDADLVVRWQSPAAARQFGLSDQDVVGRPLADRVHPEDVRRAAGCLAAGDCSLVEARLRDGYGAWRDTEWSVSDQRAVPAVGAIVVHIRDVGERKELERRLHRAAYSDQLTGLPNRGELRRAVGEATGPAVVVLLGLGGVTGVNHVRGHEVGDAVLVEAARRLRSGVSGADLPARLSGHTFAVLTTAGAVRAQLLATRLLTMLAEPYLLPGRRSGGTAAHLCASVGLAELTAGMDFDEVLRRAEMALRRAKSRGRAGGVEWYDESMEEVLSRRLAIEQELPGAIARGELDVAYQPIVELADSRPVGVEALLRWRHPSLGAVPTSALLPVAEDIGALDRIGDWVLHWTCRQLSVWAREGLDIWASVNVSVGQLAGPAFVASVTGALDAHLVPAARLMIEVAEPGLDRVGDAHPGDVDARAQAIAANLAELRALGVRTALDRFGSASTSLRQLRTLPIDLLKVDRQMFAGPVSRTAPASAVIDVVVRLGRQLGVDVVAQGLETDEDLAAARTAGCRFGQGYLLGRPQPAEHIEAYLAHALR